jgi:hypothetical protein
VTTEALLDDLRGLRMTIRDFRMGLADCKGVLVTFWVIVGDYLMG